MNSYSGYVPAYNLETSTNGASSSHDSVMDFSTSHLIRWKSGKRIDPRLLTMLEQFGEIYVERHEFFNKIFHGDHEEVFKKIGNALKKKKSIKKTGSMKRSMSMRAIRQRGFHDQQGNEELRPERFKIRTPNVIVAADDDGHGDQTTKDSK